MGPFPLPLPRPRPFPLLLILLPGHGILSPHYEFLFIIYIEYIFITYKYFSVFEFEQKDLKSLRFEYNSSAGGGI